MKKLISSLIFTFFLTFPALSQINVGLSGNYGAFYGEGTETITQNDGTLDITSDAGAFDDEYFSIFAEYDTGSVIVGISYSPDSITTPEDINLQSNSDAKSTSSNTNTVKGEFENLTTLYAIIPTGLFGSYLKAGYVRTDINSLENLQTGGKYGNTDTDGITAGFGFEYSMGSAFIRAEVMGTTYDDIELTNSSLQVNGGNPSDDVKEDTAKKVKAEELMSAAATISVGYSF